LAERSIRFDFVRPNSELPLIVGGMPVFSHRWGEGKPLDKIITDTPIGSGPYTIGSVDFGRDVHYQRDAKYWAQDINVRKGMYNFDRITYRLYKDSTAQLEAFKAGEFEYIQAFVAREWARAYSGKAFDSGQLIKRELQHGNAGDFQGFLFNTRLSKFKDVRVRQAIALAMDYEWMNRQLFYNAYTPEQRAELGIGKEGDIRGGLIQIGKGEAADNRDTLLDSGRSTLARAQEAYVNTAFGDARSLPADVKQFLKTRATGDQRHRIRELSSQGGVFDMYQRPAQMFLGNYEKYIDPRNGLLYSGRLSPEALEPLLRERLNLPDESLAQPATNALRRSYEVYDIMGAQPSNQLKYFINPDGTPVYFPTKKRYADEIENYFDSLGRPPNKPKVRQTGLEDDLSRARFSPALAGLIG
jgi:hypothetical protein